MNISEAIKKIKQDNNNASNYRLAKMLNVTPSTISNWLKQPETSVTIENAKKIYEVYGVLVCSFTEKELSNVIKI